MKLFERWKYLKNVKNMSMRNIHYSELMCLDIHVRKVYLSDAKWWADIFNKNKFWWMRKIKIEVLE